VVNIVPENLKSIRLEKTPLQIVNTIRKKKATPIHEKWNRIDIGIVSPPM